MTTTYKNRNRSILPCIFLVNQLIEQLVQIQDIGFFQGLVFGKQIAQQNLAANSVFIPEDIYKKFSYVLSLSRTQYNMFPHFSSLVDLDGSIANMRSECFKRSNDIQDEFDSLIVYLREYIANQLK